MGASEPSESSESERKKLYDPKPLKYYRPPLKSDPRALIEKISDLSLQNRPNFFNRHSSGTNSSLNRNHVRTEARLQQFKRSSVESSYQKHAFRVLDGDGIPLNQETLVITSPKEAINQVTDSSISESGRTFPPNISKSYQKCYNHPTSSLSESSENNERQSQSWRLGLYGNQTYNSDSGVESPSKEHPRRMASTPVPLGDTAADSEDVSSALSSRNIALHNLLHKPQEQCQLKDSKNFYERGDVSFDQASLSTVDDEIICLNPDSPVPKPILLMPAPEFLKKRSSVLDMDQLCATKSSSGMSSQNDSLVNSNSRNSSPTHGEVSDFSGIDLISNSVDSLHDASLLSDKAEETTSSSQQNGLSPTPKDGLKAMPKVYPNSLVKSLRRNPTNDTFSDTRSAKSPPKKVIASWRVSFTADSSDKPSSSKTEGSSASNSEWKNVEDSVMASMGLPSSFGTSNATKRKAFDSPTSEPDLHEVVRKSFSKKFMFESSDWGLPDFALLFSSEPWELNRFKVQKQNLNLVKDELNDLSLQDWHAHTRRRNKAGNVIWQLRKKIDPEFPTQAWCKFYENASSFALVPQKSVDQKSLNSVHLCEAPGAFVTSLNHFLHVNYGDDFKFDWRAVTLNPYYEGNPLSCMINDDRLILKTLDKWLFGKDNTGDLMNQENLCSIVDGAAELGEVLLVTADGSIDCQDNPSEQEDIVSWLHYCETVAALRILAPGGSFLIKMFTFYEHFSIGLMYLLNCVFRKVIVNKPVTSKEGNSEVYVVCLDYLGTHAIQPWLDVLLRNYGPMAPKNTLFPLECIPKSFLDQLYRCADFFRKLQTDVIKENLRSYHQPVKRDSYLTVSIRHRIADNFFSKYKLEKLNRSLYLVDKRELKEVSTLNIDPKREEGSFNDRRKRLTSSAEEELKYLQDDLLHLDIKWPGDFDVFWLDFPENPKGFRVVCGKPITKVNSSKFCSGLLLKIRNRVRDIALHHFKVQASHGLFESDDRVFPWPEEVEGVKRKITTLDFKNVLWASLEDGSNAVHEKNACRKILSAIEHQVFRDDCLQLKGYPLLTQFNVGLVFLLGHLFEKVGCVRPKGQDIRVLFYKYRKFNPKMKLHWDEVLKLLDENSEAVLSVVQISELSDGDFYKYVTQINNLCVSEQIQDLLNRMSSSAD